VARRRPLVLLPPSKGKARGGDGPPYGRTLEAAHPLTDARRQVLAAIVGDVAAMDDGEVGRLAGVGAARAADQRTALAALADAPTLPARHRYTGVVHGNAGLADVAPRRAGVDVRIVSGLLGLVALDEAVPDYRVEVAATTPSLGGLGPFWREALASHLAAVGRGRRVWDLLPGEHRRVCDPDVRGRLDLVEVAFVRPDGRAANAARTKVAKGLLTAALLADPTLEPEQVPAAVDLGTGWSLRSEGDRVVATSVH
jgi:uncharacterized protein